MCVFKMTWHLFSKSVLSKKSNFNVFNNRIRKQKENKNLGVHYVCLSALCLQEGILLNTKGRIKTTLCLCVVPSVWAPPLLCEPDREPALRSRGWSGLPPSAPLRGLDRPPPHAEGKMVRGKKERWREKKEEDKRDVGWESWRLMYLTPMGRACSVVVYCHLLSTTRIPVHCNHTDPTIQWFWIKYTSIIIHLSDINTCIMVAFGFFYTFHFILH